MKAFWFGVFLLLFCLSHGKETQYHSWAELRSPSGADQSLLTPFQAGNDASPVPGLLCPLHPLRHRHRSGFQVSGSGASQPDFSRVSPKPRGCVSFLKLLVSYFSDSNDERESNPPDKEEVHEKAGKTEPSFTKENSRFL